MQALILHAWLLSHSISVVSCDQYLKHNDIKVKVALSCLSLCNSMDCSPPGSSVHGILQARTLEWVAISFSNASKWKVKVKSLSHVRPSATPWTAAFQAPPSMGFSWQEYWSGVYIYICIYNILHREMIVIANSYNSREITSAAVYFPCSLELSFATWTLTKH